MSRKFKVVPVMYAASGDVYTLKLQNTEALAGLLSDGWSVMRTDVLPGLGGKGEYEVSLRRIEHCVICGRWWKLYAASSHLTIWTEPPGWVVWLLRHKTWKTMHNQQRKESK